MMSRKPLYSYKPKDDDSAVAEDIHLNEQTKITEFREKLLKYVPAEAIIPTSFFLGLLESKNERWIWIWLLVGSALTVAWLYINNRDKAKSKCPFYLFYPFALIAYFAWAVGVSEPVRELWGLSSRDGTMIMGLGAVVIPVTDVIIGSIWPKNWR